ncbi:MAG: cell wall-binding protein [Clostridiales bacterium]|nr:cell wall-binding protein [Clostridiales bacterium]
MKTVKHQLRRLVALALALAMCLPALPAVAAAEDETTTVSTWTQVDLEDISSSDEIAITMTTSDGTVYALPTANTGSSTAPTAVVVTAEDDTLSIEATGDDYAWTFTADEEVEGGYIITSPSGDYLYTTNANNGVRVNTTEMTWTLDGNYLYSSTTGRWLGVYTTNPDWRAYTNTTGNTAGQTVGFWKYSGETTESSGSSTTVTVETPSLTYSETDKTVTFKCATSGVTYYYSYSESGDYTALDGSSLDVSDHIGETLYAYAELDGSKSDTNSVELTETSTGGDETDENVSTIAQVKADADTSVTYTVDGTVTYISGKSVYVQDETGGICLYFSTAPSDLSLGDDVRASGTYTTYKGLVELTGVTDYTVIGSTSELPAQTVTIAELSSDYSDSKALQSTRVYLTDLTVGTVGTSTTLTDADGNSIVAYGASSVLTEAGATEGSVISLYAVVSDYSGYQLYVAQASDVTVTSAGTGEEDEGLTSGTYVIWAPAYNMALSSSYGTYYNDGVEVTQAEDGTLSGYSSTEVWTVTVNEDGTVTIAYGDQNLGMADSYSSLTLGAVNDQWTLEDAGDGLYYVKNTVRECYIEWYSSKSYWSGYAYIDEGNEGMFALQFTAVEDTEEDNGTVTGTLVDSIAQGDQVVIYYPNGGLAMTGTASNSKLTGVAGTVEDTTLTTTSDALVLTVRETDEGYYTFENGGLYLTSGSTGSSLTLAEKSDYSLWELEETDTAGSFYIKNVNAKYGSNNQYVEYYSGFTTYSFSTSNPTIYVYQFYKTGATEVGVEYDTDSSIEESIASWGGGGPYTEGATSVSGDLYNVNDMLDSNATFTAVVSGEEVQTFTTGTSSGSTDISNWYMGGTGLGSGTDDYLQFAVSSAGWGDMELSFRLRASNTGSGEWQLQYSTDGETFTDFTTGTYSCSYTSYSSDGSSSAVTLSGDITDGVAKTSIKSATYITFTFDVPDGAENAETLYIRLVPSTTVRANGTASTPSNQGTVRIDSVVLSGSPIVDDSITGYVAVTPDNSEDQAVGTELTMSSSTEDATILYRFVDTTTGEGEWLTYDESSKPTLDTLPSTLEVYATSEGRANSVTRILTYAAGTVSSVKFSPNGGGVYIEDESVAVTLTSATDGATIYYAITYDTDEDGNYVFATDSDGNTVYTEYVLTENGSSPISLAKGFGGASIMAYAELEGYTTSAVTTRTFTERSQETYNIYFGQMHSHTNYSDGAGSITDAYEHATEVHEETDTLDFLAVTDHSNSFDSASSDSVTITDGSLSEEWTEGKAYAEQYTTDEFVALFGYEMTWSNGLGHINTFNTGGFQSRTQSAYTTYSTALQNYYDTLKTVTDSISQFNHPGTTFGDFQDFSYYDEEIDELITLIEVGNGEGTIGSSSYFPSYEYYTRALDKGWHVAPTNNQDNHKGLWGDANTARSVVLADNLTEDDIYDAMRNYRVYATEDNDLSIYYTLDGNIMGTILSESDVDDTVTLSVKLSDPTDSSLGTVSVIVNGGYVLASQTVSGSEDTVTFNVSSDYSYYYIKVVEADGDIAVTAPVWVGDVEALGVSTFESNDALAVQNEALNMTLSLYNNESKDFDIESITFTVTDLDGNVTDITDQIVATTDVPTEVESMDTADYSFYYVYDGLGSTIYTATITGTLNGVTKVYTEPLTVSYVSADMVTNVVVDGSHYNDYVTGYYGGNMTELEAIAANQSIKLNIVTDVEDYYGDDSVLDDCSLLIISAPAKKSGTANAGDYVASLYEDEFIEAVQAYVQAGGSVIVCGLADYGEASSSAEYHTAAQQNKLLEALGSSMSLNDDEAYDVNNNGGQAYRLYLETFNMESEWLSGVVDVDSVEDGEDYQVYSQYSGCTVNVGDGTWLVAGFDTTYSIDSDKDGVGASDVIESGSGYNYNVVTSEGEAVFLACEDTGYGGTIFVSGGVFCSDFEVDADVDDYDLPYANTTIITNILTDVQVELPVTDIATVRAAYGDGEGSGSIYKVRGYVTAGTANEDNAFFDCIYIQDETGGIDIFPYAESGLELGTYMEVTGYLASYQGDIELKVMSYTILDSENLNVVDPTLVTCAEGADYAANGGKLIQVEGTVGSVYYNSDGTLAQFTVSDSTGESVVFIDGYILSGTTGENTLAETVTTGATVSAVGVLYMHPETLATDSDTFGEEVAVLRVRDCDEIVVTAAAVTVDTTALTAAIEQAEALTGSDYTASTWSAVETALTAAKEVAANAEATQAEVDEATAALTAAIDALEEAVTVPAATKITSLTNTAKGIKVTWNAVDGATSYQVYRKIGSGSWKKVKTTSSTTWTDTAAKKNGTKYQYKVYAVNSAGKSKASATETIYRLTAKHFTRAKNVSSKKISLKWTRNTQATGYIIEYSTSKSFTSSTTKTVKIKGNKNLTTTLKNLTKGKTYYIRMRPYKTSGSVTSYAGWSKVKTVKVKK